QEFCKECRRCAEACEADAISFEREPSYKTVCPSNNRGILRWAVNHDRCYQFWIENAGECSNCIAACPFFPRSKK
ncbi:MAG: 4Fe-4S double cluster binding domain-containing protein, partial [Euryarchaeota archaeon]|nr:4Fe-4S double cluster binding domain-containing protein [Euryarchaeota archaeon]